MPIFLDNQLRYYEADVANAPADSMVPFPSPSLLALVENGKPNPVSQSDAQTWISNNGNGFGATVAAMLLVVALAPLVS